MRIMYLASVIMVLILGTMVIAFPSSPLNNKYMALTNNSDNFALTLIHRDGDFEIYELEMSFYRYKNLYVIYGELGINSLPIPNEALLDLENLKMQLSGLNESTYDINENLKEIFLVYLSQDSKEDVYAVTVNLNIFRIFLKPNVNKSSLISDLKNSGLNVASYLHTLFPQDDFKVFLIYSILPFQPYTVDITQVMNKLDLLGKLNEVPKYVGAVGYYLGGPIIQVSTECGWKGLRYTNKLEVNDTVLEELHVFAEKVFGRDRPVYVEIIDYCPVEDAVPPKNIGNENGPMEVTTRFELLILILVALISAFTYISFRKLVS